MNSNSLERIKDNIDVTIARNRNWLDLSNLEINEFPESIFQIENLKRLDLSNNNLITLPRDIKRLSYLNELILTDNNLSSLPDEIGSLANLEFLHLTHNNLKSLPESFGRLKKLNRLRCAHNKLSSLPESFGEASELVDIELTNNDLSYLPESVSHLHKLFALRLSNNKFKEFPNSITNLNQLSYLYLSGNQISSLPESITKCVKLIVLSATGNMISSIPKMIGSLESLKILNLSNNKITELPESIGQLSLLKELHIANNLLTKLPNSIGNLQKLFRLEIYKNKLTDLPSSFCDVIYTSNPNLDGNPFGPEIKAAYKEGFDSLEAYLRSKSEEDVVLNEVKLILVGDGNVGKSCLLDSLCGEAFVSNKPTTHGIQIKTVVVKDRTSGTEITLNCWDFGGQPVYKPTHQLFFSAPAIYLVVWKPREGFQQNSVLEWTKLIKYREPNAKIIICATHGGPGERQPDIDRQEFWDLYGEDTICGFIHIENEPNPDTGLRKNIGELKDLIAQVAGKLPEMGRRIPKRWSNAKAELYETGFPYLTTSKVYEICRSIHMDEEETKQFIRVFHRLGHFIHYENDPLLQDIVIVKPDWLATAISFVLDDENIRANNGLVRLEYLSEIWNDRKRSEEFKYSHNLHKLFIRLMERFDLSYRVSSAKNESKSGDLSLIAQLVQDTRPNISKEWDQYSYDGDEEKSQICVIVESETGDSASAEGLFYQLIVRLHKYSLGASDFKKSVHWRRGLVIDGDFNGRALLENIGNDVRITVRAPVPETFLSILTNEVQSLIESFWPGLNCKIMVPCIQPCGLDKPGSGLFEIEKLIVSKRILKKTYPCQKCGNWQDIESLLRRNALPSKETSFDELWDKLDEFKNDLGIILKRIEKNHDEIIVEINQSQRNVIKTISKIDNACNNLIRMFIDEAKEGPRLFSFTPQDKNFIDKPKWISQKFQLTLWCEHSRMPLPLLNESGDKSGIYTIELPKEWFLKAAPLFRKIIGTLLLILPISSKALDLILDDSIYRKISDELDLGKEFIDFVQKSLTPFVDLSNNSSFDLVENGNSILAEGPMLRELHSYLKENDLSYGGLVRVINKRNEFLWVHPKFVKEY